MPMHLVKVKPLYLLAPRRVAPIDDAWFALALYVQASAQTTKQHMQPVGHDATQAQLEQCTGEPATTRSIRAETFLAMFGRMQGR